jgi:hypothetical protein
MDRVLTKRQSVKPRFKVPRLLQLPDLPIAHRLENNIRGGKSYAKLPENLRNIYNVAQPRALVYI